MSWSGSSDRRSFRPRPSRDRRKSTRRRPDRRRGNLNPVGTGDEPRGEPRRPIWFGSAFLFAMGPRVILVRAEHGRRVLVPGVDFVSAAGPNRGNSHRRGGPHALVTGMAHVAVDRARPLPPRERPLRTAGPRRRAPGQAVHQGYTGHQSPLGVGCSRKLGGVDTRGWNFRMSVHDGFLIRAHDGLRRWLPRCKESSTPPRPGQSRSCVRPVDAVIREPPALMGSADLKTPSECRHPYSRRIRPYLSASP
jgi:hypothetical protein